MEILCIQDTKCCKEITKEKKNSVWRHDEVRYVQVQANGLSGGILSSWTRMSSKWRISRLVKGGLQLLVSSSFWQRKVQTVWLVIIAFTT